VYLYTVKGKGKGCQFV